MLAPCALGGVLDDDTVPALRCRAIAGAANNQLAADAIAEQLADRGILWAPDFVANAGGIINISVELEPEGYAPERAEEPRARRRRHAAHDLRPRRGDAARRRSPPRWTLAVPPPRREAQRTRRSCAASLEVRAQRDRGRRPQRRRARRPTRRRAARPRRAARRRAPRAACARARGGGRCTRRAWPPGPTPAARGRGRSRASGELAQALAAPSRYSPRSARRRTRCPRRAPRRR